MRPYNRTSTADEAAAEEQFIERTPWANPQHPSHQAQYHIVAPAQARASTHAYQTPAGQRRAVDINAQNGSASTIEMISNPPSSTAGLSMSNNGSIGRIGGSESPVLQMKRHPGDHPMQTETSGSQSRNFASLARDSYGHNGQILSSPATAPPPPEHPPVDQESSTVSSGSRWNVNGIRPLNAGTTAMPSTGSLSSRTEGGRVPLTQRNNLGAVSVGSGSGLFGR